MPITSSAKKAHRQSLRKRVFNQRRKTKVVDAVKSFRKLVAAGDKKGAQALMPAVQKALDKAVKGKTLKKNAVSRKISRFSKSLKKLA